MNMEMILGLSTRGFDYITRDQFGYNYAIKDELFRTKDRDKYQRLIIKCAANDNYPFSYGGSGHIFEMPMYNLLKLQTLEWMNALLSHASYFLMENIGVCMKYEKK